MSDPDLKRGRQGGKSLSRLLPMSDEVQDESPPTLRQIAEKAGVSLSTVSLVLRGRPHTSETMNQRVREVAERMGWKPNPMVSAWLSHVRRGQHTSHYATLAYMVNYEGGVDALLNDPKRFILRAYWNGARTRAASRGYHLEAFDYRALGARRVNSILYNRNIQGVVLAPLDQDFSGFELNWEAFALGTIAYSLSEPQIHRAANHHFHTVTLCMENLYARGYRRMGLAIPRSSNARSGGLFLGAYLATIHECQGVEAIKPFIPDPPSFTRRHFEIWLKEQKPDVVMALHTLVPQWLGELGYSLPGDIGYAHLDLPTREEMHLPYAGIDQQPERIGAAVIDLVTAQIDRNERGIPDSPKISLVESRWVDGNSIRTLPRKKNKQPNPETPKFLSTEIPKQL